ncbi:hypothetical protein QBC47DRAFT_97298 [Echria macrotheca]|uniref:DUF7896 domain-containing protein n=1 Tax=Echria macrotheca TaxID=438768 RepID=A0AAJ0BIN7_9PEZI|nr:hypothetical protein QBC47DRAFT_97298 [Echria macrotheca]
MSSEADGSAQTLRIDGDPAPDIHTGLVLHSSVLSEAEFSPLSSTSIQNKAKERRTTIEKQEVAERANGPDEPQTLQKADTTAVTFPEKEGDRIGYQRAEKTGLGVASQIHCTECNMNPEGYGDEHELTRHINQVHSHQKFVTKWICRDPQVAGIQHTERPGKPLSDCKHCSFQKAYGAYYNAAAHLRRCHFKRKTEPEVVIRRSGGIGRHEEVGRGGGDWPLMSELRNWMEQIQVPVDDCSEDRRRLADMMNKLKFEDTVGRPTTQG